MGEWEADDLIDQVGVSLLSGLAEELSFQLFDSRIGLFYNNCFGLFG